MYIMRNSVEKGQILKKLSRHGPAGTGTLYSPLDIVERFIMQSGYYLMILFSSDLHQKIE